MVRKIKTLAGGATLVAAGYVLGLLTAPGSGKSTRKKLKKAADLKDIEKDLKSAYSEGKSLLVKLAKQNPRLTSKLEETKDRVQKSQTKVKDILSAIHGNDHIDEDLEKALSDAKQAFKDLNKYLSK